MEVLTRYKPYTVQHKPQTPVAFPRRHSQSITSTLAQVLSRVTRLAVCWLICLFAAVSVPSVTWTCCRQHVSPYFCDSAPPVQLLSHLAPAKRVASGCHSSAWPNSLVQLLNLATKVQSFIYIGLMLAAVTTTRIQFLSSQLNSWVKFIHPNKISNFFITLSLYNRKPATHTVTNERALL